jgi:4-hydroxy-tetrahydrodipicolinate synthase
VAADRTAGLIDAVRRGDLESARAINQSLIPLVEAIMRAGPGTTAAKAALVELGVIPYATVRLPLVEGHGKPAEALATTARTS